MVMEKSVGGCLAKHLSGKLYKEFSDMKEMETYGEELDRLLRTLVHFCVDIASAMEYLEARRVLKVCLYTILCNSLCIFAAVLRSDNPWRSGCKESPPIPRKCGKTGRFRLRTKIVWWD